jgi:hypothetical protein
MRAWHGANERRKAGVRTVAIENLDDTPYSALRRAQLREHKFEVDALMLKRCVDADSRVMDQDYEPRVRRRVGRDQWAPGPFRARVRSRGGNKARGEPSAPGGKLKLGGAGSLALAKHAVSV